MATLQYPLECGVRIHLRQPLGSDNAVVRTGFRRTAMALLCIVVLSPSLASWPTPARAAAHNPRLLTCRQSPAALIAGALRVDGRERTYLVHVPSHPSRQRLPLIFAFHGRGESPEGVASYSQLSDLASIIVYPRGLPGRGGKLSWSGTPTAAPGVDDIHFVRAVLDQFKRLSCVDPQRVYATGKSDGGGLAAQLACVDASEFAAVAPVAGAYYPVGGGCHPARAVAILEFHGTADRVIPYTGSARRALPEIGSWLSTWAARNRCSAAAPSNQVAAHVSHLHWSGCSNGTAVEAYRIDGGGHTWPGATAPSGPGSTTTEINARALIGAFFARYSL